MDKLILDKLEAELTTDKIRVYNSKIPLYKIKCNNGLFIYVSECEFNTGEDLRLKNLVQFLNPTNRRLITATGEFLLSCNINIIRLSILNKI